MFYYARLHLSYQTPRILWTQASSSQQNISPPVASCFMSLQSSFCLKKIKTTYNSHDIAIEIKF